MHVMDCVDTPFVIENCKQKQKQEQRTTQQNK